MLLFQPLRCFGNFPDLILIFSVLFRIFHVYAVPLSLIVSISSILINVAFLAIKRFFASFTFYSLLYTLFHNLIILGFPNSFLQFIVLLVFLRSCNFSLFITFSYSIACGEQTSKQVSNSSVISNSGIFFYYKISILCNMIFLNKISNLIVHVLKLFLENLRLIPILLIVDTYSLFSHC